MKKTTLLYVYISILLCTFSFTATAQFDDKFYFPRKEWKDIQDLSYENFSLKAGEDTITGLLLKPSTTPKATLVFFHGAGGNMSGYIFMTRPFVEAGYQVYMIDFRGYGKSSGKPTHQNIAEDGQKMLDYVLSQRSVKKLPLIIYGASIGSQIATKLTFDNQKKIDGLIIDGGMSSLTDIAVYYSPEDQKENVRNFLKFPYSAIENIALIKNVPVLVMASRTDKDVPYEQTLSVYEKAGSPKEFYEFEGEHLEIMALHPEEVIKRVNKMVSGSFGR